jgi:hypothetical protein
VKNVGGGDRERKGRMRLRICVLRVVVAVEVSDRVIQFQFPLPAVDARLLPCPASSPWLGQHGRIVVPCFKCARRDAASGHGAVQVLQGIPQGSGGRHPAREHSVR